MGIKSKAMPCPEIEHRLAAVRSIGAGTQSAVDEDLYCYLINLIARTGMKQDNPVVNLLAHSGNYWRSGLLLFLQNGPRRPAQLSKTFSALNPSRPISRRILTMDLRLLERDGLVKRKVIEGNAKHVEYRLTPFGDTLATHILSLIKLIGDNLDNVVEARAAFDAAEGRKTARTTWPRLA